MLPYYKSGSTWDGAERVYSEVFRSLATRSPAGTRILDAGCGNGYLSFLLAERGFQSEGADPSETGIEIARRTYSGIPFHCMDLTKPTEALRPFDVVTCIEVIEHVYSPRSLLETIFRSLKPGGTLILTTPYHGYVKNLAIVGAGRFDAHFSPLYEGGHIKFFSIRTLSQLQQDVGFRDVKIKGIGRVSYLWKTMFSVSQKPLSTS
jgi:2-polyprenyl-6-hydroxyphenyl methylase/3-demethylubiquinone-9 3-methyltransferase